MKERLIERINALVEQQAELKAQYDKNNAKIEVYKEVIEEMAAEETEGINNQESTENPVV